MSDPRARLTDTEALAEVLAAAERVLLDATCPACGHDFRPHGLDNICWAGTCACEVSRDVVLVAAGLAASVVQARAGEGRPSYRDCEHGVMQMACSRCQKALRAGEGALRERVEAVLASYSVHGLLWHDLRAALDITDGGQVPE